MRVRVTGPDGTILECGPDSALLPMDEGERAQAFTALTGALALLARVKLPDATEGGEDRRCPATERSGDLHRSGVVVPLRSR